ncbi:MAG: filamentous hemagglutinin N-terminal domain-containing protein, partial [Prochloraceae cyanobacterium]
QIVPDNTLGTENSVVNPIDEQVDRIDGGAIRNSNLFHSFLEFNVGEGKSAYFANPDGITNIFSRVTGNNPSQLLGTLGVWGDANLFLLNPNGILFGSNARLDLRGSFFATTADNLLFPDGREFSAINPQAAPLLNVNVTQPIGLQFEGNPETIINRSRSIDSNGQIVGLKVQSGQSLGFLGGDIKLEGGVLTAPGGQVELGGLSENGTFELNNSGSLSFPNGLARADIFLTNEASVNVSAGGGGSILVNARNLEMSGISSLIGGIDAGLGSPDAQSGDIEINATDTVSFDDSFINNAIGQEAVGNAGNINVTTSSLYMLNGSQLLSRTDGQGNAGDVVVNAKDVAVFDGVSGDGFFPSAAVSDVGQEGVGNAGSIKIKTRSFSLKNLARLTSTSRGQGDAGNISVNAKESIFLDNSDIFSNVGTSLLQGASGQVGSIVLEAKTISLINGSQLQAGILSQNRGKEAGIISVKAKDSIFLGGADAEGRQSGIFADVESEAIGNGSKIELSAVSVTLTDGAVLNSRNAAQGNGGDINIETNSLRVSNGSTVTTSTLGLGNAGSLNIRASESVILEGTSGFDTNRLLAIVGEGATGNGGNLSIAAGILIVRDGGLISVGTEGNGRAGTLTLNIQGNFFLSGQETGIFANTTEGSTGDGGNIEIDSQTLSIKNGARIAVDSQGIGVGGNIVGTTGTLNLNNGIISAETASNTGGDIELQVQELLTLRNASQISTTAGTAGAGGDGGNIEINSDFIVAFPQENSDITANAFTGNGGRVQINSSGIFGIEPRIQLTSLSDITASSTLGTAGIVEINTSDIDPNRGLTNLPEEATEVEVAQGCQAGDGQEAVTFFNLGQGGLPPNPNDPFRSEKIITPWIPLISGEEPVSTLVIEEFSTVLETSRKNLLIPACLDN